MSQSWPLSCTKQPTTTAHLKLSPPPHDWWDWYAAYLNARQAGSTQDEADAIAGRYMAEVKHVVPSTA